MDLTQIRNLVSKYSPLLSSVLSKANPVAGIVVDLLATMFDANPNDNKEIYDKISGDPDVETKIKEIELKHQDSLERSNLLSDELENKKQQRINFAQNLLAVIVIVGYFITCIMTIVNDLAKPDRYVMYATICVATWGLVVVIKHYFRDKND